MAFLHWTIIDNRETNRLLKILIHQNKTIMSQLSDLKEKLAAQGTALDGISTNVTGIGADVAALKAKITELLGNADAAVAAALNELSPLVDNVSTKVDAIGAITASLDAETDPGNV